MTELAATCHGQKLAPVNPAPEVVHLVPAGVAHARDGRRFHLEDAQAVIKASFRGSDLPIDYEHQNDDPARFRNGPAPAAGWITDLFEKANGVWGRVAWTPRAREMIAAREYRYLSPVIGHAKDGTVLRLKGAGLVHDPALELTALSHRQETPMSDLSRIAAPLDLDEGADADTILTALARQEPDPEKFVPIAAVRDLLKDRGEIVAAMSRREAEGRAQAALHDGRISPGMLEWATALCPKNSEAFEDSSPPRRRPTPTSSAPTTRGSGRTPARASTAPRSALSPASLASPPTS